MAVQRHKHSFSALWWHYGPYGPQDVHVHSCGPECDRVLIGPGRSCDGDATSHRRYTLREYPVPEPRQATRTARVGRSRTLNVDG